MSLNRRKTVLVVLLAISMVLAGCTGGAGGGGDSAEYAAGGGGGGDGGAGDGARENVDEGTRASMATTVSERDADGGDGGNGGAVAESDVVLQREAIIRTGEIHLEVENYDGAVRNLTVAVRERGSYVSDSHEELHRIDNETWTTGRVVLRVPRDNFSTTMERVQDEGTVLEARTNSQDVTDQLVDIRARLSNLRAQRDQLRELYQQANDTQDVLAVQRRLSDVQTEIERLEARQESLRQRVAYSTITVHLEEPRPEPEQPDIEQWYDTPIVDAFLESIDGVVVTLRALGVFIAYALPYLVVFGLPLILIGGLFWRRRTGGANRASIPGLPSDEDEETEEEAGAADNSDGEEPERDEESTAPTDTDRPEDGAD